MRMFGKRLSIETSATGVPQQPDLAAAEDNRIRLFTFTRALTNNQTKELFDVLLGSRFAEKSELVLTPAEGKPGVLHITGIKGHPDDVRRFAQNAGLQMR